MLGLTCGWKADVLRIVCFERNMTENDRKLALKCTDAQIMSIYCLYRMCKVHLNSLIKIFHNTNYMSQKP